jgi:imidazolonepropionase-like amidohydrolase/ABC-type multidrug transport system permease subunit
MIRLRGLGALAWAYQLETWRNKAALFWNLVFPLFTLVGFSYIFGGGEAAPVARVVPGIMTINLMAAAFFGISLHMVSLRERELYRRFRVAPVTALTVVLAHSTTALVNILVSAVLQLAVAKALFRIEIRGSVADVAIALLLGAFAFIPLGLLVGSVAQDMKSGPAISNLLFFPLTFLSGAAVPLYFMPAWIQRAATLLPSTYAVELLQAAVLRNAAFKGIAVPVSVLILTGIVGFACNALLFRWETGEPINRRGLALVVASLAVIYGVAFANDIKLGLAHPPENEGSRAAARPLGVGARILTGMTILDGSGGRIGRGQVVLDGNRIKEVGAEAGSLPRGVPVTDYTGFYMVPGLIDSHIHLGGSAGGSVTPEEFVPSRLVRDLQVYLAMGVTSVVSLADHVEDMERLRRDVAAGQMRSPRPYLSGPVITAPGGHPAKLFAFNPGFGEYLTRQVSSPEAAAEAVREVAEMKVDVIKLYLEEGGWAGQSFPVLPEPALRAAIRTARELGMRTTVHVDNDRHARMAIDAGADGIEHVPPDLSDETIQLMVAKGITLTPTLVASEAMAKIVTGAKIDDPLTAKWVDPAVIESLQSPDSWIAKVRGSQTLVDYYIRRYEQARSALRRAVRGGVTILAGSDAGNPGSFHGLALIRELELLVEAGGMTPAAAIHSATGAAAKRLGAGEIGRIAPGAFADLIVLGADPAKDIRALRDVRAVYLAGAPLDRETLLKTSAGGWRPLFSLPQPAKRN